MPSGFSDENFGASLLPGVIIFLSDTIISGDGSSGCKDDGISGINALVAVDNWVSACLIFFWSSAGFATSLLGFSILKGSDEPALRELNVTRFLLPGLEEIVV